MLGRPVEQVLDEVEQAVVGAVHVLEHHHDGIALGQPLEEQAPPSEQLLAARPRLGDAEQNAEAGGDELPLGRIGDPAFEAGREPRLRLLGGSVLADPQPVADHLGERPVRDAVPVRKAATGCQRKVSGSFIR